MLKPALLALALLMLAAPAEAGMSIPYVPVSKAWTPTLQGATSGVATTSAAVGRVWTDGDRWIATFNIQTSSTASIVGTLQIGGFPITQNALANDNGQCSLTVWAGLTLAASYTSATAIVSAGANVANIAQSGSGQAFSLSLSAANASVIEGTCIGRI